MADVNIFDLKPTVISRDLSAKYILLYSKPKVGKTSFAAQLPRNLFLATEIGYNAINGITAQKITKWGDIKTAVKQLKDPRAREMFDTVTIDTITIAADLCEKFILSREGVTKLNEIPYGQGWKMVSKELSDTLREITMLGFGLIMICHSKEKQSPYTDAEGNAITSVEPDLNKNVYTVCNALCDLIAYIGVEFDSEGNSQRWLYTRQTPTIFAGSRWKYLKGRIPFGYQELVDAIGEAIEMQGKLDGATIVDHIETEVHEEKTFQEVMQEAREVWIKYLNGAANDEEKEQRLNIMKDIINRIFGTPEFKISQAVPSQKDLISMFLVEMKDLV